MNPYASIETVWTRDHATNRLEFGVLRQDVHRAVDTWYVYEKVDGMNIRITIMPDEFVAIRGRSDRAIIPGDLVSRIHATIGYESDILRERLVTLNLPDAPITLYGEGYGPGIQKGGTLRRDKDFILFDVRVGDAERSYWLEQDVVGAVASTLALRRVPLVNIVEWAQVPQTKLDMQRLLPYSLVAAGNSMGTEVEPEGIVARPSRELYDSRGNRIMWKLTNREFRP